MAEQMLDKRSREMEAIILADIFTAKPLQLPLASCELDRLCFMSNKFPSSGGNPIIFYLLTQQFALLTCSDSTHISDILLFIIIHFLCFHHSCRYLRGSI